MTEQQGSPPSKRDPAGLGMGTYPRPVVPRFSVGERDRRWAKLRKLMERDNIDVIVTLANSSIWDNANAYGRYLTSIGGNCSGASAVFPRQGDVTAIIFPTPMPDYWQKFQDWVEDLRPSFFPTMSVIERLRELGLERGRIGIVGLEGVAMAPEGLITQASYRMFKEQLPKAEFVDATFLIDEARFVKSDEEIAMLRHAVALLEGALDVFERETRPGVLESVVYGRMMGWLIENGCEPTTFMAWSAGNPQPPGPAPMASRRPLGADEIINVELDAKWGGYNGHGAATICAGKPDATVQAMARLQYEAVQRCMEVMRPGVSLTVLADVCSKLAEGTPFDCRAIAHSRGLGLDRPNFFFMARDEHTVRWKLEENCVMDVKPMVTTPDGTKMVLWGGLVVVTPTGAKPLGTRRPPLLA